MSKGTGDEVTCDEVTSEVTAVLLSSHHARVHHMVLMQAHKLILTCAKASNLM